MAEEVKNETVTEQMSEDTAPQEAAEETGKADENWRLNRDAGAMARETLQEKEEKSPDSAGQSEEVPAQQALNSEETAEPVSPEPDLSRRQQRQKQKEEAAAQKAAQKAEAAAQKAAKKAEEAAQKAAQKEEEARQKQAQRQEKRDAKAVAREERRKEWRSLLHTAELAMLITFVVLAIDQAGLYGFLFVWLFVAVMIASVALLLLGIIRSAQKKRAGIVFLVAVIGIIVCTAWFIFLVSSQGLGLGPVPN